MKTTKHSKPTADKVNLKTDASGQHGQGVAGDRQDSVQKWINSITERQENLCEDTRVTTPSGPDIGTGSIVAHPGTVIEDDLSLGAEAKMLIGEAAADASTDGKENENGKKKQHTTAHRRLSWKQAGWYKQSFGSDSSNHTNKSVLSSVDMLLHERRGDPEEILLGLGFGGKSEKNQLHSRIPRRFLSEPSNAEGVSLGEFLDRNPDLKEHLELQRASRARLQQEGQEGGKTKKPAQGMYDIAVRLGIMSKFLKKLRPNQDEIQDQAKYEELHPSYIGKTWLGRTYSSVLHPSNQEHLAEQGLYDMGIVSLGADVSETEATDQVPETTAASVGDLFSTPKQEENKAQKWGMLRRMSQKKLFSENIPESFAEDEKSKSSVSARNFESGSHDGNKVSKDTVTQNDLDPTNCAGEVSSLIPLSDKITSTSVLNTKRKDTTSLSVSSVPKIMRVDETWEEHLPVTGISSTSHSIPSCPNDSESLSTLNGQSRHPDILTSVPRNDTAADTAEVVSVPMVTQENFVVKQDAEMEDKDRVRIDDVHTAVCAQPHHVQRAGEKDSIDNFYVKEPVKDINVSINQNSYVNNTSNGQVSSLVSASYAVQGHGDLRIQAPEFDHHTVNTDSLIDDRKSRRLSESKQQECMEFQTDDHSAPLTGGDIVGTQPGASCVNSSQEQLTSQVNASNDPQAGWLTVHACTDTVRVGGLVNDKQGEITAGLGSPNNVKTDLGTLESFMGEDRQEKVVNTDHSNDLVCANNGEVVMFYDLHDVSGIKHEMSKSITGKRRTEEWLNSHAAQGNVNAETDTETLEGANKMETNNTHSASSSSDQRPSRDEETSDIMELRKKVMEDAGLPWQRVNQDENDEVFSKDFNVSFRSVDEGSRSSSRRSSLEFPEFKGYRRYSFHAPPVDTSTKKTAQRRLSLQAKRYKINVTKRYPPLQETSNLILSARVEGVKPLVAEKDHASSCLWLENNKPFVPESSKNATKQVSCPVTSLQSVESVLDADMARMTNKLKSSDPQEKNDKEPKVDSPKMENPNNRTTFDFADIKEKTPNETFSVCSVTKNTDLHCMNTQIAKSEERLVEPVVSDLDIVQTSQNASQLKSNLDFAWHGNKDITFTDSYSQTLHIDSVKDKPVKNLTKTHGVCKDTFTDISVDREVVFEKSDITESKEKIKCNNYVDSNTVTLDTTAEQLSATDATKEDQEKHSISVKKTDIERNVDGIADKPDSSDLSDSAVDVVVTSTRTPLVSLKRATTDGQQVQESFEMEEVDSEDMIHDDMQGFVKEKEPRKGGQLVRTESAQSDSSGIADVDVSTKPRTQVVSYEGSTSESESSTGSSRVTVVSSPVHTSTPATSSESQLNVTSSPLHTEQVTIVNRTNAPSSRNEKVTSHDATLIFNQGKPRVSSEAIPPQTGLSLQKQEISHLNSEISLPVSSVNTDTSVKAVNTDQVSTHSIPEALLQSRTAEVLSKPVNNESISGTATVTAGPVQTDTPLPDNSRFQEFVNTLNSVPDSSHSKESHHQKQADGASVQVVPDVFQNHSVSEIQEEIIPQVYASRDHAHTMGVQYSSPRGLYVDPLTTETFRQSLSSQGNHSPPIRVSVEYPPCWHGGVDDREVATKYLYVSQDEVEKLSKHEILNSTSKDSHSPQNSCQDESTKNDEIVVSQSVSLEACKGLNETSSQELSYVAVNVTPEGKHYVTHSNQMDSLVTRDSLNNSSSSECVVSRESVTQSSVSNYLVSRNYITRSNQIHNVTSRDSDHDKGEHGISVTDHELLTSLLKQPLSSEVGSDVSTVVNVIGWRNLTHRQLLLEEVKLLQQCIQKYRHEFQSLEAATTIKCQLHDAYLSKNARDEADMLHKLRQDILMEVQETERLLARRLKQTIAGNVNGKPLPSLATLQVLRQMVEVLKEQVYQHNILLSVYPTHTQPLNSLQSVSMWTPDGTSSPAEPVTLQDSFSEFRQQLAEEQSRTKHELEESITEMKRSILEELQSSMALHTQLLFKNMKAKDEEIESLKRQLRDQSDNT